uniref:Uncharacterized protein n=1 Tax=Globisporangium ultimum (strain ATCC 200006 / CBS 805.95 / DAOM BR144) TaxID=431595 RepID=K3X1L6_GLOUD
MAVAREQQPQLLDPSTVLLLLRAPYPTRSLLCRALPTPLKGTQARPLLPNDLQVAGKLLAVGFSIFIVCILVFFCILTSQSAFAQRTVVRKHSLESSRSCRRPIACSHVSVTRIVRSSHAAAWTCHRRTATNVAIRDFHEHVFFKRGVYLERHDVEYIHLQLVLHKRFPLVERRRVVVMVAFRFFVLHRDRHAAIFALPLSSLFASE